MFVCIPLGSFCTHNLKQTEESLYFFSMAGVKKLVQLLCRVYRAEKNYPFLDPP